MRVLHAGAPEAGVGRRNAAGRCRIVEQFATGFPKTPAPLGEAVANLVAFTVFPEDHWRQAWSSKSLERLVVRFVARIDMLSA